MDSALKRVVWPCVRLLTLLLAEAWYVTERTLEGLLAFIAAFLVVCRREYLPRLERPSLKSEDRQRARRIASALPLDGSIALARMDESWATGLTWKDLQDFAEACSILEDESTGFANARMDGRRVDLLARLRTALQLAEHAATHGIVTLEGKDRALMISVAEDIASIRQEFARHG